MQERDPVGLCVSPAGPFICDWECCLLLKKSAVGIRPLIHERGLFGIQSTCDFIEKTCSAGCRNLFQSETQLDIGLYNMDTNQIEYFDKSYFDPKEQTLVKAACAYFF